jgi:hypothetical protein
MCLALRVLVNGVFTVLAVPVWVSREGYSFLGKLLSGLSELSMLRQVWLAKGKQARNARKAKNKSHIWLRTR